MNHPAYKSECILFFTHQMAGSGEDWKRGHEEWKRDGDKSDAAQQWGIFYSNDQPRSQFSNDARGKDWEILTLVLQIIKLM